MSQSNKQSCYVLISAAKDEEKYIETTLNAVMKQTVRPARWVIVDDGSQDKTRSIVAEYAQRYDWITLLTTNQNGGRQAGSPVIRAFTTGYELVRDTEFDFVVKLDCDLDLAPDYFERLLAKFNEDKTLGIASGVYLERQQRRWIPIKMPDYHAAGAAKMVRADCFQEIGGFAPVMGWDTIDEIRALMKGWKTRHFRELEFRHLRNEGSAVGFLQTNLLRGEGYYLTGGGKLFFLLKVMHRAIWGKPLFLGALVMLFGYLKAWLARKPMLISHAEARFYRELLNRRILDRLARLLGLARLRTNVGSSN